jgi:adenylate cyclase
LTREIERRFLLERLPADLPRGTPVRQGYVALDGDVSVRVRDAGGAHTLTVKGGTGRERVEVERPIDAEEFEALWRLGEGRRIAKVRSVVPLGEHRAEVDVFQDELDGLWIAEVEFPSPEAADAFEPPAWFGEEITGRPEWGNAALAVHGRPDGG